MDEMKYCNTGSRKIGGVDNEMSSKVDLWATSKVFPVEDIHKRIDLINEYNIERDNCQNFRVLVNVSPYCTNLLFNRKTEIVKDEGSDNCKVLNFNKEGYNIEDLGISPLSGVSGVTSDTAIRDTEYSHPDFGGFSYHCGADIFNNHRFRSKEFMFVNNITGETAGFNSIEDKIRDNKGNNVKERVFKLKDCKKGDENILDNLAKKILIWSGDKNKGLEGDSINPHLYQIDNISSYGESYRKNLKVVNGWAGFNNVSSIDIPTGKIDKEETKLRELNRVINSKKPGEFVDLYPGRDLFSFIPKVNKYRKRVEKNWDYCLTYPEKSDKMLFNRVMNDGAEGDATNLLRITKYMKVTMNSGDEKIIFKTKINHNLRVGDKVIIDNFHNSFPKRITKKVPITVRYVGNPLYSGNARKAYDSAVNEDEYFLTENDEKRFFCINAEDLPNYDNLVKGKFGFKKVNEYIPCEYYFRWFKKIKNGKEDLHSTIGKLAFSENMFGDRNAEIVFTDTVNTEGLLDNRNRPLSDIYFTVIKRNKGYDEWYSQKPNVTSYDIEYSHCFGKLTSGLMLDPDEKDYNVRRLHNIVLDYITDNKVKENTQDFLGEDFKLIPKFLTPNIGYNEFRDYKNSEIVIDLNYFLGDIVEYSPSNDTETVIENVYYRFNTAQRECTSNPNLFKINVDELVSDDYNIEGPSGETESSELFKVETSNISSWPEGNDKKEFAGNLCPEGYFYQPHYRIRLRRFREMCTRSEGIMINANSSKIETYKIENNGDLSVLSVTSPKNYGFSRGDLFLLYDREREKDVWGRLVKVEKDTKLHILLNGKPEIKFGKDILERYNLVMTNGDTPPYASFLNNTNHTFVWRDIEAYSEMDSDDELYSSTYTNGCIYKEEKINFYLKRQDPLGVYGIRNPAQKQSDTVIFTMPGKGYDKSFMEYIPPTKNILC